MEHARLHGESKLRVIRDGSRVLRTILDRARRGAVACGSPRSRARSCRRGAGRHRSVVERRQSLTRRHAPRAPPPRGRPPRPRTILLMAAASAAESLRDAMTPSRGSSTVERARLAPARVSVAARGRAHDFRSDSHAAGVAAAAVASGLGDHLRSHGPAVGEPPGGGRIGLASDASRHSRRSS